MSESYGIRTDLALESRESIQEGPSNVNGVLINEEYNEEKDIHTTVVRIVSKAGEQAMGKPQGTYITLEAPKMSQEDEDYHREISEELAKHLMQLFHKKNDLHVLVVGLGNHNITPDALGPNVIDNLQITRHMIREYGKEIYESEKIAHVSGLVPGVMAQTGMETLEILRGVVAETDPDIMIVIDALAARSIKRLNHTIQITDTGINPGSGVGNHRNGLSKASLGIPVIGIGVPTVVDAATIIYDSMSHLLEALNESEKNDFLSDVINPDLQSMFVTPKDIDETVKRLGFTISEGLNLALSGL